MTVLPPSSSTLNDAAAVLRTFFLPAVNASASVSNDPIVENLPLLLTKAFRRPRRFFLSNENDGDGLGVNDESPIGDGDGEGDLLGLGLLLGEGDWLRLGEGENDILGEGDLEGDGLLLGDGDLLGEELGLDDLEGEGLELGLTGEKLELKEATLLLLGLLEGDGDRMKSKGEFTTDEDGESCFIVGSLFDLGAFNKLTGTFLLNSTLLLVFFP